MGSSGVGFIFFWKDHGKRLAFHYIWCLVNLPGEKARTIGLDLFKTIKEIVFKVKDKVEL